jgi:hypothetical protein
MGVDNGRLLPLSPTGAQLHCSGLLIAYSCTFADSACGVAMKHLFAILLGLALSAPAMAQLKSPKPPEKRYYMETSINVVKYSEPGLTIGPTALRVTLGKKTSETFGYEGMLGFSVRNAETAYISATSTTTTTATTTSVTGEINNLYGLYIKARKNLGSDLEIFGKLGMASGERTLSTYPTGLSAADNKFISFSYGLGAKAAVEKDMSVVFDYMSYYHKGLTSVDAFSLGLSLDF